MISYCLKCRKNTESKNSKAVKTKKWRILILSRCEMCDSKRSIFIKVQGASRLLSILGIDTRLTKIPLVAPTLFYRY